MTRRLYTLACSRTFRCDFNVYIPFYVILKSRPPPTIRLHADLQQIESKVCLFTPRQAGQASQQRPAASAGQWQRPYHRS